MGCCNSNFGTGFLRGLNRGLAWGTFGMLSMGGYSYGNPTYYRNTLGYLSTCSVDLDSPSGLTSWVDGGQPGVTFGGHGNDYLLSCNNYFGFGFGGFGCYC